MQIYQQPRRRQIYKPLNAKMCPGMVVDEWGRSTYGLSYKQPGPQLRDGRSGGPRDLWPRPDGCSDQIDRVTVHRASFREWPDADRTLPAVQGDHELVGGSQERMQNVTSQRHDFVTKCLPESERRRATHPAETIGGYCGSGECAMTGKTTTSDAYGTAWTDGRRPLARPSTAASLRDPNAPMARETETSSSYQRWGPVSCQPQPMRPAYCRSVEPVNGRTVYTVSYRPPGSFRDPLPGEQPPVRGYGGGGGGKSAAEVDAHRPFYPRAHDYNLHVYK